MKLPQKTIDSFNAKSYKVCMFEMDNEHFMHFQLYNPEGSDDTMLVAKEHKADFERIVIKEPVTDTSVLSNRMKEIFKNHREYLLEEIKQNALQLII